MQVSITVGIPDTTASQLTDLAARLGVSRNSLMRDGIEMVLEKHAVDKK